MGIANSAQSLASQQEKVAPFLDDLVLSSAKLYKKIPKDTTTFAVSDRPCRIPTMPSRGGKPRKANMNGGDLGLGSGPYQVAGQITTTTYVMAFSYTRQAEYATDSSEKAIEEFSTLTRSMAPKQFADFLDTMLQTAGDDKIDTIQSIITSGSTIIGLGVTNSNFFFEDQDIDIWTGTNGTFVGSNTVQDSDIQQNVIWLTNPVPTGTYTVGQGIYVSGASATSNSGMFGLRYQQVGTNTGNWLGIQRSAWPGKYTANTIAVNGALTPQIVRAIMAQRELAMGDAAEESSVFAHANVTEQVAWEQNALLVQHIDMAQLKGDNSVDMLKKKSPTTIGGIEFLVNVRALPGYIDILDASNAGMVETKKVSFYEVGGQTLFGVIGQSGGQATSLVFYMQVEANLYWRKPRLNAFLSGIAIPHGLLGY